MQSVHGVARPRVALLSVGEESGKGTPDVLEANEKLQGGELNFAGNVEGFDLTAGTVDVVVTDGFTGNVVLKTLEGGVKALIKALLAAFGAEPEYQAHADALLPALLPLYETLDPDTYGGAILLGVDGVCTISHGSARAKAMANGIRVAKEMVDHRIVDEIRDAVLA
jgi:glycerol-3-phosphate acyltransferase PlsX